MPLPFLQTPRARQAARSLARQPAFTAIAIVSLGLALALNTVVLALLDATRHPFQPYEAPEHVVQVNFVGGEFRTRATFPARMEALRAVLGDQAPVASVTTMWGAVSTPSATARGMRTAAAVSDDLFPLLGVRPVVGRTFNALSSETEAIVSYRLWQSELRGASLDENPVITIGDRRYTIVGVMPRGVHYPFETDAWIRYGGIATLPVRRAFGPIPVIRSTSARDRNAIGTAADIAARRLTQARDTTHPYAPRLISLDGGGRATASVPVIPIAIVAIVLIIACANLATLVLARAIARRPQTALRIALGASRRDVVGDVLVECAIIVGAGVALGTLLTIQALYLLPHYGAALVPELGDVNPIPSWRVFAGMGALAVVIVVLTGILPALHALRTDPAAPLKDGSMSTTGRIRDRYNPLIMGEVALSTALLMSCALFSYRASRLASYAYRDASSRTVVASMELPDGLQRDMGARVRFYRSVLGHLSRAPHVRFAATYYSRFVSGPTVHAEAGRAGGQWMNLREFTIVSPDYLRTLGLAITGGRDFAAGDEAAEAPVVIVDEDAARRLWPNSTPVGRMIRLGDDRSRQAWLRVIGVAHVPDMAPTRTEYMPPADPHVYVVMPRDTSLRRNVVVQGDGDRRDARRSMLMTNVTNALVAAGAVAGGVSVRPWLEQYERRVLETGYAAGVLAAFSTFGLLLCALGLYGVLSYTVSRRMREFAIRIAIGARRRDVARRVIHDAAVVALAGVGVGAWFALWFSQSFVDDSFGPYALVGALATAELILFAVAAAACAIPLRRAMAADPVAILRAS